MTKTRRFFAIASAISQINLALTVIATINGISFLLYYLYTGDYNGYRVSIKYLEACTILLVFWSSLAYGLKRHLIDNPLDAMISVALVWITVPISTSIIYITTLGINPLDAFFESISGFSGTGLTVFENLESIPYVVLVWRAMTQWLGELGTVVVAGTILPFLHASLIRIYPVERGAKLVATIRKSMIDLFVMYSAYTIFGAVLLIASGMGFLDALTHSMTAIATGGMSTKDQNIGYWFFRGNSIVLITTSIIMIIGALNFRDLYKLSTGDLKAFAKSSETKGFFAILLILVLATLFTSTSLNVSNLTVPLVYHVVSAYTTTGFQIGDIKQYPTVFKIILIISMAIGGATFSTAGGIKTKRVVIALKSILWDIERSVLPKGFRITKKLGEEVLGDEEIASAITYIIIYALMQIILSLALYLSLVTVNITSYDFVDSMFEVTSALSCVGLSVGITTPTMPIASKVTLVTAMYFGRLEFLPLYLLIGYYYRRKALL
ncbi:MAG: TrkH family potassium uptake protein [Ignisphaera sp.]